MRRIFLDTEFTQFRDGQLLSWGLVSDDDRECYVEVADPTCHARASDFCKDVGVPDDAETGARVAAWLESFEGPVVGSYDYKLDWRFLESALRAAR